MPEKPRYGVRSQRKPRKLRMGTFHRYPTLVDSLLLHQRKGRNRLARSSLVEKGHDVTGLKFDEEAKEELREAKEGSRWGQSRDVVEDFKRRIESGMSRHETPFDELDEYDFHNAAFKRLLEKKKKDSKKETLRQHLVTKRAHHQLIRTLFRKPIVVKLSEKVTVRILSTGILNPDNSTPTHPARAFVCVFINGKRLFFYRSSGEASKQSGRWFPCGGAEMNYPREGEPLKVGWIIKLVGHPNPNAEHRFPKWVDLVSRAVARNVWSGKIKLKEDTTPAEFQHFQDALNFYPHLEEQKKYGERSVLPELDL
jgi:hypothetical protein